MSDVTAHAPDIVGSAYGTNDAAAGLSTTTAAALAYFQTVRGALPGVPHLVWGVPVPPSISLAATQALENAIFAAVAQANDPLLIPIPVSTDPDPWFTGAGFVTNPAGSGNNDVHVSGDGTHGLNSWHRHWAARSDIAIRKVIAERA